ncbi:hypothetical protein AVEN_63265-1, partial [Araneus ventricosus]
MTGSNLLMRLGLLPTIYLVGFQIQIIMATARDENEYRLTKYLLSNYDKSVRPARHTSEPVNVTFGLALTQIIDV